MKAMEVASTIVQTPSAVSSAVVGTDLPSILINGHVMVKYACHLICKLHVTICRLTKINFR